MKWIKYFYNTPTTNEDGSTLDQLFEKALPYSEEALQIAQEEAYNDEYTIYDDGLPEPVIEPTTEEMFNALLGVTE